MALASQGPRLVGRYLLCDQIGAGGMATIHLARLLGPQGFSRTVAVKQLYPQFAQNPEFVGMFLDEARLAVRIRHGNVISPIDIVANGDDLLIVMDYVNGESLAALLRAAGGPLRPALASAILVQVLLGLHAAHEATREQGGALGLVHRDVSPQNILIGQDGVARVLDFGIAKAVARSQITEGGTLKGKIGYMAPEQLRLEEVDRRTDLFTAGIVLWEMLAGTGLFQADTFGASIDMILNGEVRAPSALNPAVSPELDALVLKALSREPRERFQDALSMAAALQQVAPPASTLEVIGWVEQCVGAELARKAELVRQAESRSWEGPLPSQSELAGSKSEVSATPEPLPLGTVSLAAFSARGAVTLTNAEPPPAEAPPPNERGHSTGRIVPGVAVTVGRTGVELRKRRKWLALSVAALVVGLAAVVFALSPALRPAGERSSAATSDVSGASPASAPPLAKVRAAEPFAEPAATAPPAATIVVQPVESATAPAPAASVRASAPASLRSPGSIPTRNAASSAAKKPTQHKSDNCNPPWTVNEQNIKVFKTECLR